MTDRLNSVLTGFSWMPDGKSILCCLVPAGRGDEPPAPTVPTGPNVQETSGNSSPTRTYQDLLANLHDEALFAHYTTTKLAILGLDGSTRSLGAPAIYYGAEPSPDAKHVLVTTIGRPFSYLQTFRSFPQRIEVRDLDGNLQHLVADIPLAENIPIEGVRLGPRYVSWVSERDATLVWTEALDGGDPRQAAAYRDQWMMHAAPFQDPPQPAVQVEHRAWGASFTENPAELITYEYDRDRRWMRILLHDLSQPTDEPCVLTDRSIRDQYGDPGRLIVEQNARGHAVVRQDGPWVYRAGQGATPEGRLPFLDRQHLNTLETERLWRCQPGQYERVVSLLPGDESCSPQFVTSHQSTDSPPNYFLRDGKNIELALTEFPDPTPQIRGISKQLVKYARDDGVELSATLYLPANYQEGQRLPLIVWAYPIEFSDADTAGQITTSPWLFTRIRGSSHLAMVTQGYAVLDGATIPIIGDPETMNDTFVEQMVAAAQAAIDKAVEMGVADANKVAVGGYSYGAFMTANLLAHCNLFQAGLARSGAYNRTLTPFGFQSERRPLWEAKDVYFNISPFMHADKIKTPLLMTHGEEDNNSGTFPMQSKRLYQAIKGNGGTARLVMLPEESHGYRARESVLHVQAETLEWLDKYVKHTRPITASDETAAK
jgi:dipeptidyl aminopeptidase/acylaminoacyl peptidase